jgi:acetyl/propionyl-CoA carboxylase alpha subunit
MEEMGRRVIKKKEVFIMSRLVSPMGGRIKEINVRVGQVINQNDEVLVIEAENKDNEALKEQPDEQEEFPRYQMLFEYFTCSYFTAV